MATPIPANTARFTLAEVVQATGGTCRSGTPELVVEGVTTDSRGDVRGKLFVALSGEHFDGHRFAADVAAAGARAVLVAKGRGADVAGAAVVEVDDTLVALGSLARLHRRRWGGTLVAVAGSAGKTTTRSAIAAALEAVLPGAVHSVAGNLNNRIGVPMVLFGLAAGQGAAVVEIGTNSTGEVRELTRIASPNIGVLTLVDVEHAEGLGSLDDIEEEEGALLRGLLKTGTAIANGDDERAVRQLVGANARKKLSYGIRGAVDYRIARRESIGLTASRVTLERPRGRGRETIALEVPLFGMPGALAVAAAVAVADRVAARSVPVERLAAAFARGPLGEPGRLRPVELGDRTVVLDDSYNANPASVRAAVAAARELADDRAARLVLVLGEMRELGAQSREQHELVGRDIGGSGAAVLIAVAGDAECFVPAARAQGVDAAFAVDAAQAVSEVLARVRPGDVVLVKASRGVHAEQIVEALVRERGRAA
ncbi:MAG TPA: UDP-N-acetylmuramoyl-tripeptide--D-alanyl-D-alanine ligase [Polyangiaceae bacterium]|jgi:UDP-N-acetylmuramoyl-tripeptide--D-alanyl-D-alanine ligase|nr:UDP-N-acetylmuramoyl-tripeptide--D-alanyl-D-alanine ligase [Polyangiaceae bacterium]